MTDADKPRFLALFTGLCEYFDKAYTQTLLDIYWHNLSHLEINQVDTAIMGSIRTLRFFPKVTELLEILHGDDDRAAFVAWESLLYAIQTVGRNNSVRFEDGKNTRVVLALGGWMEVCNWLNSEMHYRRNESFKLYKATPASNDAKYLPGLIETNNMSRGFIEHIPNPITIGNRHTDMAACVARMPHNGKTDAKTMLGMGG